MTGVSELVSRSNPLPNTTELLAGAVSFAASDDGTKSSSVGNPLI